ncbi:hypothetical protein FEM48_Zijuj12G0167300 [Ziziphus jujuba var. spinosa]|uniref:F-box domain-containing protein n=1 Tax=Ziziphus jujuba var. spinosa TaxID=714518 RepID=A0A978UEG9_ZIZJJ|nr:hypothetical protein FEM48_Zijuj12G0167300 [Ziziphus jujuba var. spinosa]
MAMTSLPDELWTRILEIGVQSRGFTYKDLCCLSISSRRLRRLSNDDSLWSHFLSSDFPLYPSASPLVSSKSIYKLRFEKVREKRIAAQRRALLRKESQIAEHSRKIREFENRLAEETSKMKATLSEVSNLRKVREASVALNVWQPEVVRGRHKELVEQSVVPVESRVNTLEMEFKVCKQQILVLKKAYNDEKQRLDTAKEELSSLKYHPLQNQELVGGGLDESHANIKTKKLKRSKPGLRYPFASHTGSKRLNSP